jgi:hypothetical protein
VALRAIKDFAENFKNDNDLYWKYMPVTRQEVEDILIPKQKIEPKIIETQYFHYIKRNFEL